MMPLGDFERKTVEEPCVELFAKLGWETLNCFAEFNTAGGSPLGRDDKSQVVLTARLLPALERLNPDIPEEAFQQVTDELVRDRSRMSAVNANRETYEQIKNGIKVQVPDGKGGQSTRTVRIIDWENPANNDFLLCSQLWVTGEMYTRRPDLVGFVNGIPLVFAELKASHTRLKTAFDANLADYRDTIPHLFWFNAVIILSNGSSSKIGSVTSAWEHFAEWPLTTAEERVISLESMVRETCEPARLLDMVENFTLFMETGAGPAKLVAKSHQYHGVNAAFARMRDYRNREGKLGVFWHTQGSGKSISMIFFAQKVMRKLRGNWTFVIVTDRRELDEQIYKNFARCGVVTEKEVHARSGEHLRRLLTEDHRYVFTLIHKFREPEELSARDDIIVITDESHRTQYDTLALNMRTALPNASFIAFTGTPLIAAEEKTRETFGDYVSVYNFKQSVDDGATVPLYYENRIPHLQLTNEHLNEDMYRIVEDAELNERQMDKLEREFSRQYQLITRDDRLEAIAADIVEHFMGRGYRGKAMVVCIDKATAVKMYDKVQKHWEKYKKELRRKVGKAEGGNKVELEEELVYMEETDMAVVVSQAQGEIELMRKRGLDILRHRKRMESEDMAEKFKDADDVFRLVFVCAMWMTGFDVPSCSTIYLDKPMRNHTLMQTIARANRVLGDKENGLIVDYIGVFRSLEKALAVYGSASGGGVREGELPVMDKSKLVNDLNKAIDEVKEFCAERGVDLDAAVGKEGFDFVGLVKDTVDAVVINEDSKNRFLVLAVNVGKKYKAVLPDPVANEMTAICRLIKLIADEIRSLEPETDISEVKKEMKELLDVSVIVNGYVILEDPETHTVNLAELDFDKLRERFLKSRKHIEVENLKNKLKLKLRVMIMLNRTRMNFLEQFQGMLAAYNSGSLNVDEFFNQLIAFAQSLAEEEQRSIAENLTEEELAIFDLLTNPDMHLSEKEIKQVKQVAHQLLETLKVEKLVLDWRKHQQSRAAVRVAIKRVLDEMLPRTYTPKVYEQKCTLLYQHVYESYYGQDRSVYGGQAT